MVKTRTNGLEIRHIVGRGKKKKSLSIPIENMYDISIMADIPKMVVKKKQGYTKSFYTLKIRTPHIFFSLNPPRAPPFTAR